MSQRVRRYCLTLNNPTTEEITHIEQLSPRFFKRGFMALEYGAKGTPHIQGFINLKNAKTLTAVKKFMGSNRYHLEQARGTDFENWNYIMETNEGKALGIPIMVWGDEPSEEGDLDVWEDILLMIEGGFNNRQIIRKYPAIGIRCQSAIEKYRTEYEWAECRTWRDVEVEYIAGPTGCGKSRAVLYNDDGTVNTDVYRATNAKNPFDKYDGEGHIVFEEFRSQYTCRDMLNWIDGHPLLLPARYADRMAHFTKVTILSNWRFEEQYQGTLRDSPETHKAWQRRVTKISHLWE